MEVSTRPPISSSLFCSSPSSETKGRMPFSKVLQKGRRRPTLAQAEVVWGKYDKSSHHVAHRGLIRGASRAHPAASEESALFPLPRKDRRADLERGALRSRNE